MPDFSLSLPALALYYLLFINLFAFILMGLDKRKAKRGIPERTLFLPVLLGGGAGGCLGMWTFHHKTKHWYFRFGFPLITLGELAGVLWLLLR